MMEENLAPTPRRSRTKEVHRHHPEGEARPSKKSTSPSEPQEGGRLRFEDKEFSPDLREAAEIALPPNHPVYLLKNLTRGIYVKLEELIDQLTHRPSPGFGFSSRAVEPVKVESMKQTCDEVIKVLNALIFTTATDELMVAVQTISKDMKTSMQSYRLLLADEVLKGGVPEDRVGEILDHSMAFQRFIADPMTAAASLAAGFIIENEAA